MLGSLAIAPIKQGTRRRDSGRIRCLGVVHDRDQSLDGRWHVSMAAGMCCRASFHPVSDAVAKFGPPTTKFQLANGRMAFDWLHYGPCAYSAIATSPKPDSQSLSDWKIETWNATADCEAAR